MAGTWKDLKKGDKVPSSAVKVSSLSPTFYVTRSLHNSQWTPGYYDTDSATAYVPWGGVANTKYEFQVLMFSAEERAGVRGVDDSGDGTVPAGAVPGGVENDQPIYICRGMKDDKMLGGKVHRLQQGLQ